MTDERGKKYRSQYFFIQLALSFGLGLGARIYIIGILIGGYLDKHYGASTPYFTFFGILLAVFLSFYRLFKALPPANFRIDKAKENDKAKEDEED